jgi:hypothetical protein
MNTLSGNTVDTDDEIDKETRNAIIHDFRDSDITKATQHELNSLRQDVSWSDSTRQSDDAILQQVSRNVSNHGITFVGGSSNIARQTVIRDILRSHNQDGRFPSTLCFGSKDIYSDVLCKYMCIEPRIGYDMQQYAKFLGKSLWRLRVDNVVIDDDGLCRAMMFNMMDSAPEEAHYIVNINTDFNDTVEESRNIFLEENTCDPAVRAYIDNMPYDAINVDETPSGITATVQHWMD